MALGDYTVNAIPEGYVLPKGNGRYEICVNKVFLFANDMFNFEKEEPLWIFSLKLEDDLPFLPAPTGVDNKRLRDFKRHGYGKYFPVLSRLHEIENLKPQCWEYKLVK